MDNRNKLIQQKIDTLVDIMGKSVFLKLVRFLVDVRESEYDIKVLMTRRFLDLFLAFEEIIDYMYQGTVCTKGEIVSNISVAMMDGLEAKRILIVDDIVLHGRALDEIFCYLTKKCGCKSENIHIKVFLTNTSKEKISSPAISDELGDLKVSDVQWRWISGSIVQSFWILGQPYVSYLPYVELDMSGEEATNILSFIEKKGVKNIASDMQKYCGVESYLYFVDDIETSVYRNVSECNMIRVYVYKKISKVVVVPYVFLKPIDMPKARKITTWLLKKGVIKFESTLNTDYFFGESENDLEKDRHICCALTYLMSRMLGMKFFDDCGAKQIRWSEEIERVSLGIRTTLECSEAEKIEEYIGNQELCLLDKNSAVEENEDIRELISDIYEINEEMKAEQFLNCYLKRSGEKDEKLANENKKRMRGIEYLRLSKSIRQYSFEEFWRKMISMVDSGQGTLTMVNSELNHTRYVDSLLYAGEQNPTCNEENLICVVYPLLQYEAFCKLHSKTMADRSIKEEIKNKILSECSELRAYLEGEELKEYVDEQILEGCGQYFLKRVPMYEQNALFRKALAIEKRYERY